MAHSKNQNSTPKFKQLLACGSVASLIFTCSTQAFAKDPYPNHDFDFDELSESEVVESGSNCYLITAISEPLSNEGWGRSEFEDGFENTPWAANNDSAALASKYPEYAFLAPGAYWEHRNNRTRKQRPSNATYILNGGVQPTAANRQEQGILYFKGSSQLHFTYGGVTAEFKQKFYLGADFSGNCDSTSPGGGKDLAALLSRLPDNVANAIIARLRGSDRATRIQLLGRLVDALLLPRNVVAAGGLATQAYVNDLADTILERLPSRHFQKLQVEAELTEVDVQVPPTDPVRGLWKTSDSASGNVEVATTDIDGNFYVENPQLTSIYTEPSGTRVWARGFGGSKQPYSTGGAYGKRGVVYYEDVYNNFYSTHGGLVVGVDTSIFDNLQVGLFGNYGNINLQQYAGINTGNGSWTPSGFGGGVMASYWEENFYVQGLFGATAFSGDNKRRVILGNVLDETYTATKATTSYVGALRVGAPIAWGGLILEPQATAIWNHNQDSSYTESGRFPALALKLNAYTDQFLETTLGAKFAWPIKQGERNLLAPNFKVAWLADWDTNNGSVKFKRAFSRLARSTSGEIPSNQETQYGVLLEGGVDYTIAHGPTTAWKLYAKGGAKIWLDAQTDWRTSGGITFQF